MADSRPIVSVVFGAQSMRPSSALIYFAVAAIAITLGAAFYSFTALGLETALLVALAAFMALIMLDQQLAARADRKRVREQLAVSDLALQDALNEIDMLRGRLAGMETDTRQAIDASISPVLTDVQAVGALLAQVTEAMADADHRLTALENSNQKETDPQATRSEEDVSAAQITAQESGNAPKGEKSHTEAGATEAIKAPKKPAELDEKSAALLQRVALAVQRERFEVAMQSIVSLPHRRARAYATHVALKLDGAGTLDPTRAAAGAHAAGVTVEFAQGVISRAVTLADRFASRESTAIVFTPVSRAALSSSVFAEWITAEFTAVKDLASRLVLEVSQADVREFSPLDFDLLGTLADLGFRFAVVDLNDAKSDLFDLSSHGFRYAKAPVHLFLGSEAVGKSDIHPEDLADLATRNGMDMIVNGVETEGQVVELLDCNLKYAQGNLFARARTVDVTPRPRLMGDLKSESPDPVPARPEPVPQRPTAQLARSA
ncbi:MAG: EAL domain-containing protein [Pseudomonadota bacterium]